MTAITAVVQPTEPPYVIVTVDSFTGSGNVTVYRIVDGTQTPVRGGIDLDPSAGAIVLTDLEAPFGVEVTYLSVRGSQEVESAPVTLATDTPWLSHPVTGEAVPVTIAGWPTLTYTNRRSVIGVSGRRSPVVISDIRSLPTSEAVLLTRTRTQLQAMRDLLEPGDTLLLRPVCEAVEPDWISVGDVVEGRLLEASKDTDPRAAGSDWRRLTTLQLAHVEQPFPQVGAVINTLQALHDYEPGTLADLHARFPGTLLDIARTNLVT